MSLVSFSNRSSIVTTRFCSSIGGTGLTDVQGEYLRVQGIYNIDAKQIGTFDNQ